MVVAAPSWKIFVKSNETCPTVARSKNPWNHIKEIHVRSCKYYGNRCKHWPFSKDFCGHRVICTTLHQNYLRTSYRKHVSWISNIWNYANTWNDGNPFEWFCQSLCIFTLKQPPNPLVSKRVVQWHVFSLKRLGIFNVGELITQPRNTIITYLWLN